ncbi:MAG: GTP 3',8-cyclase MoaA [Chloroherpetonaceae bacterium]|nr:GTP 3',8-cyclase MoaA [Chloroherpetonaceae bacterium]
MRNLVAEAETDTQNAQPTATLIDNHGRPITYIRMSVTDRCNLRCLYCMPAGGIDFLPQSETLSYAELLRLARLFASLGICKFRITGGEPFVRTGLIDFLEGLAAVSGIEEISITTNGVLTAPFVRDLKRIGISSINLSLDTLRRERFKTITRRDEFENVMKTFYALLEYEIPTKINVVVTEGVNTDEIVPLALLSRDYPVSVRFIEEMPFNGTGKETPVLTWNYAKILAVLKEAFPSLSKLPDAPFSTSMNYAIEGHLGTVGIIAAYSRTFCGTCNRLRLTPKGEIHTCLYDNRGYDIKTPMRQGASNIELEALIRKAVSERYKDGYEAEANRIGHIPVRESMSTIGG